MAKKPDDDDETVDDVAEAPLPTGGRRKLVLLAGGGLLLLLVAGGAGAYFGGLFDGLLGGEEGEGHAAAEQAPPEPVFYPLPDLLVSLNTGERRATLLKLKLSLELADPSDQPRIERQLPRIIDYCQIYLRELRLDEVRGSAGITRMREELLRRIAAAVAPARVNDLLFNEMFVQ